MVIERRPLRDKVREEVLERLLRGVLPVGTNINEPELARELGVSRTPLREALLSLEREGLLDTHPGRGWWVAPLTPETVLDVYPIVGTLEALAVRLTPPRPSRRWWTSSTGSTRRAWTSPTTRPRVGPSTTRGTTS
ncbi:MAG: GntR family transcriptional regulator [Acidimicrobiia bacterium]|nr:GntR family transcriptional regulator [Acidimicrobiia bacterium]